MMDIKVKGEDTIMTNGDKIRHMTDEALARWIADDLIEPYYYDGDDGYYIWLNWLKHSDWNGGNA